MASNIKNLQKLTEHNAALEHERLTSLINSMADGVIAVDENQKVAVYNGAALNILDVNSELKNRRLRTIINLIDKSMTFKIIILLVFLTICTGCRPKRVENSPPIL